MRHTTQIELENQYDLVAVKLGVMSPEDVRRLTVTDALVDTGATGLCLPIPLIEQLGLTPIEMRRARAATGIVDTDALFRGSIYDIGTDKYNTSYRSA